MTPQELRERTTAFAVDVARFAKLLFENAAARSMADQLQRAAASAAANYRSAGLARSHAEFRSKIAVALEEADEALHWLQFAQRAGLASGETVERLVQEAAELAAILGASRRTATRHARERSARKPR